MANQKEFKSLVDIVNIGRSFKANFKGFVRKDAEIGQPTANGTYPVRFLTNITEGCLPDLNKAMGTPFQADPQYHNFPMNVTWFVATNQEAQRIAGELVKGAGIRTDVILRRDDYVNRDGANVVGLSAVISQPRITPPDPDHQQSAPQQASNQGYAPQQRQGNQQPAPAPAPTGNPFQAQFNNAGANGAPQAPTAPSGAIDISDDDLPF